jgi:tetratricopeptide (TPR) repeat protein
MQAEATWREAQMTSMSSISALRQLLIGLSRINGDKTIILISGGWPLEERDETSLLSTVASEAAAARATVYTLFVPSAMFSADRRGMTTTPARDQFLHSGPLETLAGMTGGGSFRGEVNAQAAFERIGRELAGYYRLGVEKNPSDQDGKGRRLKVQVPRGGLTVRARDIFDVRTYEDRDWAARLASALESPVPSTGLGLRVTSYVATDMDERGRYKLVIAGEASRIEKGDATFQVLVRDLDGKKIIAGEQSLGEATGDVLPFASNIPLPAGSYIVRAAVMDAAGRVGSVDHRVDVQPIAVGDLSATGPLLIRVPARGGGEPRFALDGIAQDERLALEIDLQGDAARLAGSDVSFEVASAADGPALVRAAGNLTPGNREGSTMAQGFADMRMLPPGTYVARAKISAGGQPLGEIRRTFTVVAGSPALASADAPTVVAKPVTTPPLTARALGAAPRFAVEQVLAPQVLNAFLDRIAARPDASSAAVRDLLAKARNTALGELTVPDTQDSAPVAFVRGLSLLAQSKLDPAADAFRSAMRAASDFYPAMIYLGACYAAGGNDKDASGAWRTALIREGDTLPLHVLLTDALLRQGDGDLALETVDDARTRWPEDQGLKRRFVVAALLAGKYADGLQAAEELLDRNAADEPTLALATLALYEAFQNHRPVQSVDEDRARMTRFAAAYRAQGGPSVALIDTWMAAVGKK